MRSFIVALGCLAVVACGNFDATSREDATGSSGSGAGSSDDSPAATNNTPDDNAKGGPPVGTPPLQGVFVSASRGSDTGSGTMDSPLKSLAPALVLAKSKNLPVNACAEVYAESLTVSDGVSMYGYFDCSVSPWVRGTKRSQIASPSSPAITAHATTQTTRIEGFDAHAPDVDGAPATDTVGSSIGLDVRDSQALTISEALVHAGNAAGGVDGTDAPINSVTSMFYPRASQNQEQAFCNSSVEDCATKVIEGPLGGSITCAIGPNGGPGGHAGDPLFIANQKPSTGTPRNPQARPLNATAATAGENDDGAAGTEGNNGAVGVWLLGASGFVRGNGAPGSSGAPGQGGGGGLSSTNWWGPDGYPTVYPADKPYAVTARGGGGGWGGCPGQAGTPGTGGAASIGALVIASTVTFENVTIESSAGGRAGKGALGSPGTPGLAGSGVNYVIGGTTASYRGGAGGAGGGGGGSGHGAPGPSIALAYSGVHPTLTSTQLMPGPAGAGQPELRQSSPVGDKVVPAVVGISEAEHHIQ